jgi:transposase
MEPTIEKIAVPRKGSGRPRQNPVSIIADKGYDSDPLRDRLLKRGIELICPYRKNNKTKKYEDGRKLRRYRRRWKVERTFAWLQNFRRLVVGWEREIQIYQAFFHLACILITLRQF